MRFSWKHSSTSSYMASLSTISLVMRRDFPVRFLCSTDALCADSRRASRLLSFRRDAATNALCGVSSDVKHFKCHAYLSWFSSRERGTGRLSISKSEEAIFNELEYIEIRMGVLPEERPSQQGGISVGQRGRKERGGK